MPARFSDLLEVFEIESKWDLLKVVLGASGLLAVLHFFVWPLLDTIVPFKIGGTAAGALLASIFEPALVLVILGAMVVGFFYIQVWQPKFGPAE